MNARDPVAVIGLGAMGFPIARCLLAAGVSLTGYNRTTSRADALVAAGAELAGNFLLVAVLEALGEVFVFAEKARLDRLQLLQTLNDALFTSPVYQANGERMCRGAFSPAGFQLALGLKDVRLVLRIADRLGVPMPIASLAHDHFLSAVACGKGDLDWTALSEVLREGDVLRPRRGPHQCSRATV